MVEFSLIHNFLVEHKYKSCPLDHRMCLETARGGLMLVKHDGKENIRLQLMTGKKKQTFKEIK